MNKQSNDKHAVAERINAGLARRHAVERLFRCTGLLALLLGLTFLCALFFSIISKGYTAFQQTYIQLEIDFDEQKLDPAGERIYEVLSTADYGGLVKQSLRTAFPAVTSRQEQRLLYDLVSFGAAYHLRDRILADPALIGQISTYLQTSFLSSCRACTQHLSIWLISVLPSGPVWTVRSTTLSGLGVVRVPVPSAYPSSFSRMPGEPPLRRREPAQSGFRIASSPGVRASTLYAERNHYQCREESDAHRADREWRVGRTVH